MLTARVAHVVRPLEALQELVPFDEEPHVALQPFVAARQVLSHPLLDGEAGVSDLFLQEDHVAADVAEALVEFEFGLSRDPDRLQQALFGYG